MFNHAKGYFKITHQAVEVDKYYVLSFINFRKPMLLRFSCKTRFLANQYIILKLNPSFAEVIKGSDALERGLKISKKRLKRSHFPEKYCYPADCVTWQKKKQHRTKQRERVRNIMKSQNKLKQFTILYKLKTYTIFEFTIDRAFKHLSENTGMTWAHFISKVTNEPLDVTKDMVYIRTRTVTSAMINHFFALHHGKGKVIRVAPKIGQLHNYETGYLAIHKPKKHQLTF